jgi:aspartyl-tRNA(Asn)/glutamyl-tRNA(Gln) amidotransferase subunit C
VSLSEEQVRHVARLARLGLADDEIDRLKDEMSAILGYAEKVGEVATDDVAPTSHPYPLSNVLRPDEAAPSLQRTDTLANAPQAEDDRFRVPRIVGEDA